MENPLDQKLLAVRDAINEYLNQKYGQFKKANEAEKKPEPKPKVTVEQIVDKLGKNADLVKIELARDAIKVQLKHYLGKEKFNEVASVMKDLGAEYVSAGKDSHFMIKLEEK